MQTEAAQKIYVLITLLELNADFDRKDGANVKEFIFTSAPETNQGFASAANCTGSAPELHQEEPE
jgi:hypothetical protein